MLQFGPCRKFTSDLIETLPLQMKLKWESTYSSPFIPGVFPTSKEENKNTSKSEREMRRASGSRKVKKLRREDDKETIPSSLSKVSKLLDVQMGCVKGTWGLERDGRR